MEFGWLVGFDYFRFFLIYINFYNYKGVTEFFVVVDVYLSLEIAYYVVIGLFFISSFSCFVAVFFLNFVLKFDITERRIILDFSWFVGFLVNDGIFFGFYLV